MRFLRADYTDLLDFDEGVFDLLISLYAGFVSEACTRHQHDSGRGIADTKSPFAYLFERVA